MKLLDAQEVKTSKDLAEAERFERVKKLNEEESAIVHKLNQMKLDYEIEANRLIQSLAELKLSCSAQKAELEREVGSLESRRVDAMKPIGTLQKEAEERILAVEKREEIMSAWEKDVEKRENVVTESFLDIQDQRDEIVMAQQDLDKRESRIASEESRLKESQEKLADEWITFHKEVIESRDSLAILQKEVEDTKKTNNAIRQSNEAEALRLIDEDRTIRDKYVALEQAHRHLGINS